MSWIGYSLQQRIRLSVGNTLFGLSGTIFNFIFSVLVIRLFSPALWGDFTPFMLLTLSFNLVTGWGNKEFLLKEFSIKQNTRELWQTSLISRSVLLMISVVATCLLISDGIQCVLLACWITLNYFMRSFDSVIVFDRKFNHAVIVESTGFVVIICGLVLFPASNTIEMLLFFFIISCLVRMVLYAVIFRSRLLTSWQGTFSKQQMILSFPYFLPACIGFLLSKADTFAVALNLSKEQLGEYYLLTSLLSYCHVAGVLAITPFLQNLYRMSEGTFRKTRNKLISLGLAWSIIGIFVVYAMARVAYKIDFPWIVYLLAWLTLPPYFIYFLTMQNFIRQGKPYPIVVINGLGALVNFLLSYVLIGRYGLTGGIIASACTQWLLLAGFAFTEKLPHLKLRIA